MVTGRWNGKTYQSYVSDLTDNVKTTVLSVLSNKPQVWNMEIFVRFNLTMREQDTAVLYIYVRLVGEHYQPGIRDPETIIATVRHVSNEMLFEAVTMTEAGETDRIQTFIILTSYTSHINNDRHQSEYPIASWDLLHDKGDIHLFIMNQAPPSTFTRMMVMGTFVRRFIINADAVFHQLVADFSTDDQRRAFLRERNSMSRHAAESNYEFNYRPIRGEH